MTDILDTKHRQIFCYDKDIGHLFVPKTNARIFSENGEYFVKTNSFGFRSDIEFKEKKLPNSSFYSRPVAASA